MFKSKSIFMLFAAVILASCAPTQKNPAKPAPAQIDKQAKQSAQKPIQEEAPNELQLKKQSLKNLNDRKIDELVEESKKDKGAERAKELGVEWVSEKDGAVVLHVHESELDEKKKKEVTEKYKKIVEENKNNPKSKFFGLEGNVIIRETGVRFEQIFGHLRNALGALKKSQSKATISLWGAHLKLSYINGRPSVKFDLQGSVEQASKQNKSAFQILDFSFELD